MAKPSQAVSAQYPTGCATCEAEVGQACRSKTTGRVTDTHAARIEVAREHRVQALGAAQRREDA